LPRQVWNLEAAAKGDLPNSEAKNNRSGLTGMLFNRRINQHIYFVASAHTFCYFFFFFFSQQQYFLLLDYNKVTLSDDRLKEQHPI